MRYNIDNLCNSMEALKCAVINKETFIFSKNMACRSITSSLHTCLMVLLEGPGSGCFKWTVTYFLVTKGYTWRCQMWDWKHQQMLVTPRHGTETAEKISETPPNSFPIPLIKRVSLPPSRLCHSGLACDCFHIFFELLSFIFYHIFLAVSFIFNT